MRVVRAPLRRLVPLVLALAAGAGLALAAGTVGSVAAATPDVTVVGAARYEVQPDQQRVHVTVDLTITNQKSDTVTTLYYVDRIYLQVLPGTTSFSATTAGAKPSVRVTRSTSQYRLLQVALGKRLTSHHSMLLTLAFDLPDPGGAPARSVRIGQAVVSFPAWAYGTQGTPGSSVTVVLPAGFSIDPSTSGFGPPSTGAGGTVVLTSSRITDPLTWLGGVVADRPGAYRETLVSATLGPRPATFAVRAWTDDAAWGARVADLVGRGMPLLAGLIGAPYPRSDRLVAQEAVSRSLGGYSGLFDPRSGTIEIAYDASGFVVLHELSHAWFNGSLLADRWANEAWASYYGQLAVEALKVKASVPALTPSLEKARIPLNAWEGLGREDQATESYAYAATLAFANAVAARAGADALRRVWTEAEAHEAAYQPSAEAPGGAPETSAGPVDWRGLLDLLENTTGRSFDDLWRRWVVRPEEASLLDARTAARADYAATLADAGTWQLPASVRQALDAWQFDAARGLLAQVRQVLDQRGAIAAAASAAGLTPPPTLERAFEGSGGVPAALGEAQAELAAIKAIAASAAARPAALDPFEQLGLLGAQPAADLGAARSEFAAGDLADAVAHAEAARTTWEDAGDVGRSRALTIVSFALAALLVLGLLVALVRGRRRRLPAGTGAALATASVAHRVGSVPVPPGVSGPVPPDAYATLAAQPDRSDPPRREPDGGDGSDHGSADGGSEAR